MEGGSSASGMSISVRCCHGVRLVIGVRVLVDQELDRRTGLIRDHGVGVIGIKWRRSLDWSTVCAAAHVLTTAWNLFQDFLAHEGSDGVDTLPRTRGRATRMSQTTPHICSWDAKRKERVISVFDHDLDTGLSCRFRRHAHPFTSTS